MGSFSWVTGAASTKDYPGYDKLIAHVSADTAERLERVLTSDPGTGVLRHADAGYAEAIETAEQHGLELPSPPTAGA